MQVLIKYSLFLTTNIPFGSISVVYLNSYGDFMLFTDLFYSIRKNPVLFIFIQIVITSFIVYSAMSYYHVTEEESNRAQIVWGDKEYVFVSGKDSSFQTPEGIHQIVDLT